VRRRLLLPVATIPALAPALASAAASSAALWTALGGAVSCGLAIHLPHAPARLLCSAAHVPPPKAGGSGDAGFVFLGSSGRPQLARLSQDSFTGTHAVTLAPGTTWHVGSIGVTCAVKALSVRCHNGAGHGFTITRSAYRAF